MLPHILSPHTESRGLWEMTQLFIFFDDVNDSKRIKYIFFFSPHLGGNLYLIVTFSNDGFFGLFPAKLRKLEDRSGLLKCRVICDFVCNYPWSRACGCRCLFFQNSSFAETRAHCRRIYEAIHTTGGKYGGLNFSRPKLFYQIYALGRVWTEGTL